MTDDTRIDDVEALLNRSADAFPYPPTPPIARAVTARLREPSVPPETFLDRVSSMVGAWLDRPRLRLATTMVAAVLLGVGVLLAVPQSRTALAEIFGLEHVQVSVDPTPAAQSPAVPPILDSFAHQTTLEDAQTLVDFTLRLPTYPEGLVTPDAVYFQRFNDDIVIITAHEEPGFDLYQSRLVGSFFKSVPSVVPVTVAGGPGLWVPEGGHGASYLDVNQEEIAPSKRTVARATLLWEENDITYRLETDLPLEEAIRVAESLR